MGCKQCHVRGSTLCTTCRHKKTPFQPRIRRRKLVEEEEGNFGLWLFYILTGAAGANLVSWLIFPRYVVSVGSSGAVFGLFAISVLVKISWSIQTLEDINGLNVIAITMFISWRCINCNSLNWQIVKMIILEKGDSSCRTGMSAVFKSITKTKPESNIHRGDAELGDNKVSEGGGRADNGHVYRTL